MGRQCSLFALPLALAFSSFLQIEFATISHRVGDSAPPACGVEEEEDEGAATTTKSSGCGQLRTVGNKGLIEGNILKR